MQARRWSVPRPRDQIYAAQHRQDHHVEVAANGDIDQEAFALAKSKFKQPPVPGSQVAHAPFTVECPVFVWPGKTFQQFREDIIKMWLKVNGTHTAEQVTALMEAYGVLHPAFLDELVVLATDRLRSELEAQNINWLPGVGLKYYWSDYTLLSPAITDMLDIHFAYIPIATTIVEQVFTVAGSVTHANMTTQTAGNSISFRVNVGSAHCRGKERDQRRLFEQLKADARARHRDDVDPSPADRGVATVQEAGDDVEYDSEDEGDAEVAKAARYRELRSAAGHYDFLQTLEHLSAEVDELQRHGDKVSRRSVLGKKKDEQLRMRPHVRREMAANARTGSKKVSIVSIKAGTERYNSAWINEEEALPAITKDPFLAAARSKKWLVAGKKNYLVSHYKDGAGDLIVEKKYIMKARLEPKDDDPEDYMTLINMLIVCWRNLDVQVGDLDAIIDKKY